MVILSREVIIKIGIIRGRIDKEIRKFSLCNGSLIDPEFIVEKSSSEGSIDN